MATQREADGHEIPSRSLVPSIAVWSFQAAAPPVGFVEVTELPLLSPAAQKVFDGQDTAVRTLPESIRAAVHAADPPVGFVEVITWPALSTATQRFAAGHDTPGMLLVPSMVTGALQVEAGLAGFTRVILCPLRSVTTQSDGLHETAASEKVSMFSTFQAAGPPVGLFDLSALPSFA